MTREPGLLGGLVGDGRPLLSLTGVALLLSGAFALFLSARREFLPHDIAFLGQSARDLCAVADCRVVRFMFHDRVAFGGTFIAIGVFYLYLSAFPLRGGLRWAWRAFAVSGAVGFATFLAYLGYGYLDTWHGAATLIWYGVRYAPVSRAFLQTLLVAGTAGFGCAIGVHYVEGYTDPGHLAPAWTGAGLFYGSLTLLWRGR